MRVGARVIFAVFFVQCALAADNNVGTWKLNASKSSNLGQMASRVLKISKIGENSFRYEVDTTTTDGKTSRTADNRVCDGKEHQLETDKGVTYTCTETHTVFMRDGRRYLEYVATYSTDRNTVTSRVKSWSKDGQPRPEQVWVFERQ